MPAAASARQAYEVPTGTSFALVTPGNDNNETTRIAFGDTVSLELALIPNVSRPWKNQLNFKEGAVIDRDLLRQYGYRVLGIQTASESLEG